MAAKAKVGSSARANVAAPGPSIVITRDIDAPRPLVWAAWTEPQHIEKWWGPNGFTNTLEEIDVRPGGRWRHVMHGPNGSDYPNHVVFLEVVKPERLVYTSADPQAASACQHRVIVTFEALAQKTRVTLTMTFMSAADRDDVASKGAEGAGAETLARLDQYVAALDALKADATMREIVTIRTVPASRELVWRVWTDPEHVTHWWGPVGFSTTTTSHELKVGGIWSFVMHGPDGTDYLNRVEFLEVRPPELLSYRHAGEGAHDYVKFLSTVTFEDIGSDTRITLRAVFETAELRDFVAEKHGAVEGGQQTLARFANYVSRLSTNGRQPQ